MKKMKRENRVSASMVVTGLVMILLFLGLVALLVVQRGHVQTYDEARKEQRLKNLADLNAENEKILAEYRWVDKARGIVGIPIDQAMNLALTELQSVRPHAAGPITNPPPAGAPPPPASPAPAAGAKSAGAQQSRTNS
jgi:hypothetical protein